jgi:hypothetical protein
VLPGRWLAGGADLPPAGRVPRGVFLSAAAIVLARNLETLLGLAFAGAALLRLGVRPPLAAAAIGLTFFGGPLIFYGLVGMTHAPSFALAGLLLLLLVRARQSGAAGAAAGAGLALGCAVLVRYGAVALLPAALWAVPAGARRRLAFAAAAAAPCVLLPLWWRALFGGWLPPPYGGELRLSWLAPWQVLAAPVHGLFLFHPALLLAAAGLARDAWREMAARRAGWGSFGLAWLLGVAAFNGCWSEWANAGGYGQRFMIDALPACALGFAGFLGAGLTRPAGEGAEPGARGKAGTRLALARAAKVFVAALATTAGYVLFFAAVGGLVTPPPPAPWPQRLGDYAPLLERITRPVRPGAAPAAAPPDLPGALRRASFLIRTLAP